MNFTVAGLVHGLEVRHRVVYVSASELFVLVAPTPMPPRANPSQSSFWFAPPKRARSAASIMLRSSSIDGPIGASSIASNTSWIQRRLPGHR